MSDPVNIVRTIRLNADRCAKCGRWHASETATRCPTCAERTIDGLYQRIQRLENENRGLRGALKRKRGKENA